MAKTFNLILKNGILTLFDIEIFAKIIPIKSIFDIYWLINSSNELFIALQK